ncbi:MAG: metal-dependent transcriptional regulator [Spirochaetales bacterium]|nr:metal-dependent transcriptional regulator [Spirochaetales bacterium]
METEKELTIADLNEKYPAALEYLTEIFLIHRDYGLVKNSVIAKRLGVSKPAVTQAMKRLKKYSLIEQDLYGSILLTPAGRRVAAKVLKRHYLIEHLLIHQLDYPWVKSDEEAARIQATLSDEFTDYLFEFFNRPDFCPHGNPFPGSVSEKKTLSAPRLSSAVSGTRGLIVRITEEGEVADGLLQFCYENRMQPGVEFVILKTSGDFVTVRLGEIKIDIPSGIADFICFTE